MGATHKIWWVRGRPPPPTTWTRASSFSYSLRRHRSNRHHIPFYYPPYSSYFRLRSLCRLLHQAGWVLLLGLIHDGIEKIGLKKHAYSPTPKMAAIPEAGFFVRYFTYLILLECPANTLLWKNFRPEPPPLTPPPHPSTSTASYYLFYCLYLLLIFLFTLTPPPHSVQYVLTQYV